MEAQANTHKTVDEGQRKRWPWALALVVILCLGLGITYTALGKSAQGASPQSADPPAMAEVAKGTLSGTKRMPGTLDFTEPKELRANAEGTVTWLPQGGDTIGAGEVLYAIDNVGRYLMHGQTPAWRGFTEGMDPGPDIEQLDRALAELGFFYGDPGPYFTWSTMKAIMDWQRATGQKVTGEIELGSVVFLPTDVRVAGIVANLGSVVNPESPVLQLSGQTKEVTVNVKLSDQQLAQVGTEVEVELPAQKKVGGVIRNVGQTQDDPSKKDGAVVIPVTVALNDQEAVSGLQRINVSVDFPSEVRENVLYVPLEALSALSGDQLGVEVIENGQTRKVPVKVGLIAGGFAEIEGEGITEGTKVVVPS